ncbi:MAG: hypothetical protein ACJAUO_001946 [Sediminicola sp.]
MVKTANVVKIDIGIHEILSPNTLHYSTLFLCGDPLFFSFAAPKKKV